MANFVYIASSLDGYIATEHHGLDWLSEFPNPDNSDYGFAKFMKTVDALLMGKNTFEIIASFDFWPYDKPVYVLSTTLQTIPDHLQGKAEIINGELTAIVRTLKERGFKNLYIDGGKTIQSFLKEDMIDEMIITRIPVLLGDGIPLFGNLDERMKFEHIETEVLNNTFVKSRYKRIRTD